jgi:putative tricarboxylic transport membrane protein
MRLAVALLGVDVVAIALSTLYFITALGYPMGTLDQPGPGRFPVFIGGFLVIASTGSLIYDWFRPRSGELSLPKGAGLGRVLSITAATIAYVILLPYIGHVLAAVIIVFVVLQTMGLSNWLTKIAVTAAMALGSYYLFDVLLQVPLPKGILG